MKRSWLHLALLGALGACGGGYAGTIPDTALTAPDVGVRAQPRDDCSPLGALLLGEAGRMAPPCVQGDRRLSEAFSLGAAYGEARMRLTSAEYERARLQSAADELLAQIDTLLERRSRLRDSGAQRRIEIEIRTLRLQREQVASRLDRQVQVVGRAERDFEVVQRLYLKERATFAQADAVRNRRDEDIEMERRREFPDTDPEFPPLMPRFTPGDTDD
jgi:hypothetical protein